MIWFMAPDLPALSGGLKMVYRMVEALNDHGRSASVWHGTTGHEYPSFDHRAPVRHGLHAELAEGDILVMHEVGGARWSFLAGDAPVVMLCQGHTFVFEGLPTEGLAPAGYPGWPHVASAIVTSEYVERVLRVLSGPELPIHRVPVLIDSQRFVPLTKERLIAYMPRRREADLRAVVQLSRSLPSLRGWTFVPIDGVPEAEVASVLGRSAIFLSGAEREGFGMPGAEAMAAGCYVVGFTGDGGAEYMTQDVAGVVHDADVLGMAEMLAQTAREFDEGSAALAERTRRGREGVIARYDRDQFTQRLLHAMDEISAPGSSARIPAPVTIPHYQSHAPKPGLLPGVYRAARRLARRTLTRATDATGKATSP